MTKKRIAVLGGGLGAMSAVYGITSKPGWEAEYDITVYQMGWRLGGKGASGRGPNARVQEHGLHIWLGFYENAFRVMHGMFEELNTTPGVYHSIDEAFEPLRQIGIMGEFKDGWKPWIVNLPKRAGHPGVGEVHAHRTVWDIIVLSMEEIAAFIWSALSEIGASHVVEVDDHEGFLSRFVHKIEHGAQEAASAVAKGLGGGILGAIAALI
ncbi:MAG: NAD(P)-binding protein, partial [Pseudomonadota bacterium]